MFHEVLFSGVFMVFFSFLFFYVSSSVSVGSHVSRYANQGSGEQTLLFRAAFLVPSSCCWVISESTKRSTQSLTRLATRTSSVPTHQLLLSSPVFHHKGGYMTYVMTLFWKRGRVALRRAHSQDHLCPVQWQDISLCRVERAGDGRWARCSDDQVVLCAHTCLLHSTVHCCQPTSAFSGEPWRFLPQSPPTTVFTCTGRQSFKKNGLISSSLTRLS